MSVTAIRPDDPDTYGPPHDVLAEQSVIGAAMFARTVVDDVTDTGLRANDFYRPAHETLWGTILRLHHDRSPVDPITVANALLESGDLARIGGAAYLHTCMAAVPTAANATYYARIVRDRATQRRLQAVGRTIIDMGTVETGDVVGLVAKAQAELGAVADAHHGTTTTTLSDVADAALDAIQAGIRCTQTPWPSLNGIIDGWVPSYLVAIGARPGAGKTFFAAASAIDFARHGEGLAAAYFTFEMSAPRLYQRALSIHGKVPFGRLRQGSLTEDEWNRISRADAALRVLPLTLEGSSGWTAQQVAARARALHREARLGMVVVDHIGLVRADRNRDNRQSELSDAADVMLHLAHELDATVVLCTQLNRGPMQRADKRPVPSDIRDTDRIEQNADLLLLLHRDKDVTPGVLDVGVLKNRDGQEEAVSLGFDAGRIYDLGPR